jgi:excisionase family DNA binding protein
MTELITIKDVCKMLSVSERTARTMVTKGEIPFIRVRRQLRFDPEKVLRVFSPSKSNSI